MKTSYILKRGKIIIWMNTNKRYKNNIEVQNKNNEDKELDNILNSNFNKKWRIDWISKQ